MREYIINSNEAGKRLDKFIKTLLPKANDSFIYKMLRKKNIKLNDKKAEGNERLCINDNVKLYFSEETFDNLGIMEAKNKISLYERAYKTIKGIEVVYEDGDILIVSKPSNVLSQKDKGNDLSVNEWLIGYLMNKKYITEEELSLFRPSVLNRLDRNTKGLLICSKSLRGSQVISSCIKERSIRKFYYARVKGQVKENLNLEGFISKDEKNNKVSIYKRKPVNIKAEPIKTNIRVLRIHNDYTELEIELITGKSHQIRAHLSSIGHPVLGDMKYGDSIATKTGQELYAVRLEFPKDCELDSLKGRIVTLNGYMEKQRAQRAGS